jgi:transposase
MSEDVGASGASALTTGHMSDRMSSRIAVVGGRRRWSVDQQLSILREAFGPNGSVSAACQRHAIGSGMPYTWRRQALAGDLTGAKRTPTPSFAEVEVSVPSRQRPHRDRAAVGRAAHRRRGGGHRRAGPGDVRPCPMIPLPPTTRIYLACGATDMRKGFDGLAVLVQQVLEKSPHSGALFAFRGKRGDLVKLLWYDGQGLCLFSKLMDRGRFIWPITKAGKVGLEQLESAMAKALAYGRKRWDALTRYIDDGIVEIDNNIAERAIRAIAIGRKNWLFAGSKAGGERAAAIYSVIETAKLNGVEPQAYIADVIEKIASGWTASRWDELMPSNWTAQTTPASMAA